MALGKEAIELATKIGYGFADLTYLETALTHSSYTNEMRKRGIKASSNERLEFLGDAVLEIVISEHLYSSFSKYREGALTKMRQRLVCEKTLARIANTLDIGSYLNLGNGEESADLRHRPKVLADALEALIGAVYLDSLAKGEEGYKSVILSLFADEIEAAENQRTDYKTMLQQLAEQEGSSLLEYRVVSEDGPEHNKLFTVEALINNNVVGRGSAQTKKDAEMQAARMALQLFGVVV
ncbi:MAG: ribonuclease III [Ruminococcaceae bacterium]|nr:ribonuclease III [Oscillospiraceae bacterium]